VASPAPSRPRRVPPEEALPEPAIGASQAAGAGAIAGVVGGAGITAGAAAGLSPSLAAVPALPLFKLGAEAVEKAVEALRGFQVLAAAREDAWALRTLQRVEGMSQEDVLGVIADERARRGEFDRKQEARIRAAVGKIMGLPEEERLPRLRGLLAREQWYSQQRSQAMATRSLALADRTVLRRSSPSGAFWVFEDDERTTVDCRMMGGKFWPWEALAVLHPPTHTGCRCHLIAYEVAVAAGLMKADPVIDVDKAVRLALAAKARLHEGDVEAMRVELIRRGLASPETFDSALYRSVMNGRTS
jgi:hypothetical protein